MLKIKCRLWFGGLFLALLCVFSTLSASDGPPMMPLGDVKPGMTGVAYTIYAGEQIEKIELEVIGVLPNALGPKTDVILVRLKGEKAQQSGVVAGMSGSPVYIDGKLVGALSLKLGIFTREPIGGVTPIAEMLENSRSFGKAQGNADAKLPDPLARQIGASPGAALVRIDTPLISSGLYPAAIGQYAGQLEQMGLGRMNAGGSLLSSSPTSSGSSSRMSRDAGDEPESTKLEPGSMAGIGLVRGNLSLSAGCTVTAVIGDTVYLCGHPFLGWGPVSFPLESAHVLTTLDSTLESTKIMTTGGIIGTVTDDQPTAVSGQLGKGPPMIPLDIEIVTPSQTKNMQFEVVDYPKLTPLLMGLVSLNSLLGNVAAGEQSTISLEGRIEIAGHTTVRVQDYFASMDSPAPDGVPAAARVQTMFAKLMSNPYEKPQVERVVLRVRSEPGRREATIQNVWSDRDQIRPGDTLGVKVLLRPYRGGPVIREVSVLVPPQATPGPLRVLVSDADSLDRFDQTMANSSQAPYTGLEALIAQLNRQREGDRMYVTLRQQNPTLVLDGTQLPDVPPSAANVFQQKHGPGGGFLLGESSLEETSYEMGEAISGQQSVTVTVN
jgi:hypothetical protein